jgi:hypothetical protein
MKLIVFACLIGLFALPWPVNAQASRPCRVLCLSDLEVQPTITIESFDDPLFELAFGLDIETRLPRVELSLEASVEPFDRTDVNLFTGRPVDDFGGREVRNNVPELELEVDVTWLTSDQTNGWLEAHADIVDSFGPAQRLSDRSAYTHKLNFEFAAEVAVFKSLPQNNWLRRVTVETALDYLVTGLPDDGPNPWSLSIAAIIPIVGKPD